MTKRFILSEVDSESDETKGSIIRENYGNDSMMNKILICYSSSLRLKSVTFHP